MSDCGDGFYSPLLLFIDLLIRFHIRLPKRFSFRLTLFGAGCIHFSLSASFGVLVQLYFS